MLPGPSPAVLLYFPPAPFLYWVNPSFSRFFELMSGLARPVEVLAPGTEKMRRTGRPSVG